MKKTIVVIMLLLTLTSNTLGVKAIGEKRFTDIPNTHWALESIYKLVSLRVVDGYGNNTFKPDDNITIDAFIKLTVTALGYTNIKNGTTYWAENYINKALQLGLIEQGQFDSYRRIITREEMASIIIKALGYVQEVKDIEKDFMFVKNCIKDFYNIDSRYLQEVVECYYYGLITGKGEGFDPKGNATRAAAVTVVLRLLDASYRKPIYIPPTVVESEIQKDENGIYFDVYRFNNYKESTDKEKIYRVYECPNGEPTAINLMYALDKVYQDNEGYVYLEQLGKDEHPIGIMYSCLDTIERTNNDIEIIEHSEVNFYIKHSNHDTGSSYSVSLYYKKHDMTYMERYYKYQKSFDTMLMYLYEDKFQVIKDQVIEVLKLAENMDVDQYNYTIKMDDREIYITMNQNHSVKFQISVKGGKIDHFYPVEENKPCIPCMKQKGATK